MPCDTNPFKHTFTVKLQYSHGDHFSIGKRVEASTADEAARNRVEAVIKLNGTSARQPVRAFVVDTRNNTGTLFELTIVSTPTINVRSI